MVRPLNFFQFLTQVRHDACQSALSVCSAVWRSMNFSTSSSSVPGGQASMAFAVIEPGFTTGWKFEGTSVFRFGALFPEEGVAF
jgi:hypothetical protein